MTNLSEFVLEKAGHEIWACFSHFDTSKPPEIICRSCKEKLKPRRWSDLKYNLSKGKFSAYCNKCRYDAISKKMTYEEIKSTGINLDIKSQRREKIYSRVQTVIDKICSECGNRETMSLRQIKDSMKKYKSLESRCYKCKCPGYSYTSSGYKLILKPDHPNASSYGYVPEHRLVMESIL